MRQELDEQLCAKYPKIFVNRNADMQTTAMCWGFECGDGWYNILDQLCANIQHHTDWHNRETVKVPQVVASQVKEKFGGLRFYYDGGDDYISGVASMAESMSVVTCEECGAPGQQRGRGWIYTACDAHINEKDLK
jgi:hypothetical protein